MDDEVRREPGRSLLEPLKHSAALFVSFSAALLVGSVASRIMELISISMANGLPQDIGTVAVRALQYDIVVFLKALPLLFIPFFIAYVSIGGQNTRHRVYAAGGTMIMVLYGVLIKYFATAHVPLGSDLFGYSLSDIAATIKGGLTVDAMSVLLFIVPLALFWTTLIFVRSRRSMKPLPGLALLLTGIVLMGTASSFPDRSSFKSDLSYHLAVNKAAYFLRGILVLCDSFGNGNRYGHDPA